MDAKTREAVRLFKEHPDDNTAFACANAIARSMPCPQSTSVYHGFDVVGNFGEDFVIRAAKVQRKDNLDGTKYNLFLWNSKSTKSYWLFHDVWGDISLKPQISFGKDPLSVTL